MGIDMGQAARVARSVVDRQGLERLETHFISHEVYRRDDLAERQIRLARAVSSKIIPQLLRLHSEVVPDAPAVETVIETLAPTSSDISGLADIVLGNDLEAAMAYIIVLRDKGMSMDTLFVELLEPTARYLGHLWDEDECDFIDVTLGVARLQKLLATFNNSHMLPGLDKRRNVLMATTPGDQHYFGATMVERFLLAAGWTVQSEFDGDAAMIADLARTEWFSVAGLTAGSEHMLGTLKDTISLVREKSCNPTIGIMVGGPMFTKNPALVHEVGADATAPNAPAAVLVAQKLFDLAVLNS
ncbi:MULTISPECIES: B12-binding domain-containing protein [unclassified Novosphingobium]|uniref:cobalamin B12-binding domain-containing protein n=1 Tax=unclassified Novosphingobium TaxID=2644732 RepID=UPI0025E09C1B|nr:MULTISPECIES: cobalamin B12-binding domain-containing protein [unclassified Novosphingobium]HQS70060.1 cobalamin B12-binding domain-containing protein [Novosphingobium sp.]